MPLRFRERVRLGPLPIYFDLSRAGISWTLKLGAWSWNSRRRRQRFDIGEGVYWENGGHHPRRSSPR